MLFSSSQLEEHIGPFGEILILSGLASDNREDEPEHPQCLTQVFYCWYAHSMEIDESSVQD